MSISQFGRMLLLYSILVSSSVTNIVQGRDFFRCTYNGLEVSVLRDHEWQRRHSDKTTDTFSTGISTSTLLQSYTSGTHKGSDSTTTFPWHGGYVTPVPRLVTSSTPYIISLTSSAVTTPSFPYTTAVGTTTGVSDPPPTDTSSSSSCPTNMILMECYCQATCADPYKSNGCYGDCTDPAMAKCICPDGFYLRGNDCVPPQECGCYNPNTGIIPKGEFYTSFDCSEMCLCDDEVLSCDYHCSPNAVCISNPSTEAQCTCIMGYYGNGINCTRFQNCQDLFEAGYTEEGVYTLDPSGWFGTPFDVYCRGGWMVLQRQHDGSIEFNRTWISYKEGFGNADGDHWLGNDKLSFFTNKSRHQLRVDLGRILNNGSELVTIGTTWFYEGFQISSEETNFLLTYDVGNMDEMTGYDYLRYHNDTPFTTVDRDNDRHSVENCAARHSGGWWFKSCYASNLNGKYGEQGESGICIIKRNDQVPVLFCDIIFTEMAMRPM